ncbi:MAG: 3-phosphoserine/phosphohydroxythreonine transaminase [Myxococcota bacterium]
MSRVHNFSAGPAVLPLSVIEQLADALPNFQGTGLGLMELSHRSPTFDAVHRSAEARLRRILGVPDEYAVIFLQGGASLQFHMTAQNLLAEGESADFLVTGVWAAKALKEANRTRSARAAWDGKGSNYDHVPDSVDIDASASYVHYTTNNTIYGTQFSGHPAIGDAHLVADMSSDICSRPIDVSAHDIIYAGAQKNLGPSGVTAIILSPWALEKSPGGLNPILDYRLQVEKRGLFNTPNTFGIYALERVLAWLEDLGGLDKMAVRNQAKADALYAQIDSSDFWNGHAQLGSRSQMNVSFRSPSEEMDARFLKQADAAGFKGLKGHRLVGGLRASIYNACPPESVDALVDFMRDFEQSNG